MLSNEKAIESQKKKTRTNDKAEVLKLEVLTKCLDQLSNETPLRSIDLTDAERDSIKEYQFLTNKKVIYVCNVSEDDLTIENSHVRVVKKQVQSEDAEIIQLSASFEHEVSQLDGEEKKEFLHEFGLSSSGLERLAKQSFKLLGLETFLTTGEKETRAWTISVGTLAPKAAGEIHTDFEKGFIRANVIHYDDFVACNGYKVAKEKGKVRQEGKEYIVKDGDIIEFCLMYKVAACGMLIGIANLIPGVSGATMAVITNQYKKIIDECDKIMMGQFATVSFGYLLGIGLGALIGIVALSNPLHYIMIHHEALALYAIAGGYLGP